MPFLHRNIHHNGSLRNVGPALQHVPGEEAPHVAEANRRTQALIRRLRRARR